MDKKSDYLRKSRDGFDSDEQPSFFSVFVPLYLVILAFFILLNSIATHEKDKQKRALSSIHQTFASGRDIIDLASETGIFDSVGRSVIVRNYFHTVKSLAKDELELIESDIVEVGDKIQLVIPISQIFEPGTNKVSKGKRDFLTKLSQELSALSKGERIEVEVVFSFSKEPVDSEYPDKNIYKAGEIARVLTEMGLPEQNIIIGMEQGAEDKIIMNFLKRDISEHFSHLN